MTQRVGSASHHMSPLRYPGGKGKLAPYIKEIIRTNRLYDHVYVEPFAGGGGVGLALLLNGYVKRIILNDLSRPIYAFWRAVLFHTQKFEDHIINAKLNVSEWEKQREIFRSTLSDEFELGFAAFYLNRTNHSGVLNGGMIGGYSQRSSHGLDGRFNKSELAARIHRIGKNRRRIEIFNCDANDLLSKVQEISGELNPVIYLDPPYFKKGRDLYYDFYGQSDHENLRDKIENLDSEISWIVSYDNAPEIASLYTRHQSIAYDLNYSVRNGRTGRELMFFSDRMVIPPINTRNSAQLQNAA